MIYLIKFSILEKEGFDIQNQYDSWEFVFCMNLVHLRLWYVRKVGDSLTRIFKILEDIFLMHLYTLSNMLSWTLASIKLIVFMHYFACGWLYIGTHKDAYDHFSDEQSYTVKYVESWSLITMTISTVGYGVNSPFGSGELDKNWSVEMVYLFVVIIAGIILFSLVTNEIFSYKRILTVEMMMLD